MFPLFYHNRLNRYTSFEVFHYNKKPAVPTAGPVD